MNRSLLVPIGGCMIIGIVACSQRSPQPVAETDPGVEDVSTGRELPPGQSVAGADAVRSDDPAGHNDAADAQTVAGATPEMPAGPVVTETPPNTATETSPDTASPDASQPAPTPVVAASVVRNIADFYAGLDRIRVKSELGSRIVDDRGLAVPNTAAPPQIRELTIERPNRLSIRTETSSLPDVVSDGNQLTAWLPVTSKYLRLPAPLLSEDFSADPVLRRLIASTPTQLIPVQLMSGAGVPGIASAEFVKLDSIDGVPANRLRFEQEQGFVWNLWVAAEGDPLLLQVSMDRGTRTLQVPGRGETEITIMSVDKLYEWELNPALTDDDFVIEIPETADEVQDLAEFFAGPDVDDE